MFTNANFTFELSVLSNLASLTEQDLSLLESISSLQQESIIFDLKKLPHISVIVDADKTPIGETEILQNFLNYFQTNHTELTFNLLIKDPLRSLFASHEGIEFNREELNKNSISNYTFDFLTAIDLKSFPDFLANAKKEHFERHFLDWHKALFAKLIEVKYLDAGKEVIKDLMDKLNFIFSLKLDALMEVLKSRYNVKIENEMLDMLLVLAFEVLIKQKQVKTQIGKVDERYWHRMIDSHTNCRDFLSDVFRSGNVEGFDIVYGLIGNKCKPHNELMNTFLHECCDHPFLLQRALDLSGDINSQNSEGNTALHLAAIDGNLNKARFLLLNGADPSITNAKNETFWNVMRTANRGNLDLYRDFHRTGIVLKHPPAINDQTTPSCGPVAADCAATYHRESRPTLFQAPRIPVHKKSVFPKASESLLSISKEKKLTQFGEFFSAFDLASVVSNTECSSHIHKITSYNQFVFAIVKALEQDLPIIIPFSTDGLGMPAKNPNNTNLHWATIIGFKRDPEFRVLVAQYGEYNSMNAFDLYNAFQNMPDESAEVHYYKQADKKWFRKPVALKQHDPETKHYHVLATNLKDFKGHLIVVTPPPGTKKTKDCDNDEIINIQLPAKRTRLG